MDTPRCIVNPVALQGCWIQVGDAKLPILDLSLTRVVVESADTTSLVKDESTVVEFILDRHRFSAPVILRTDGEGWARLEFERVVPSSQAHLRSFLSPKKMGESIVVDQEVEGLLHFHGLNESELWYQPDMGILFTYLDSYDPSAQFILRLLNEDSVLKVGKILRVDYMAMQALNAELPMLPLSDREIYAKLGECRDIVTNIRPTGQNEYALKQRLLKVISGHLYSTSPRFEYSSPRPMMVRTPDNQMSSDTRG